MTTTEEVPDESLAKLAYAAYGAATNFQNYQGNPMPEWFALPDTIKLAWGMAAAVIKAETLRRQPGI